MREIEINRELTRLRLKKLLEIFQSKSESYEKIILSNLANMNFAYLDFQSVITLYEEVEQAHVNFTILHHNKTKPWDQQEVHLLNLICLFYCSSHQINPIFIMSNDWNEIVYILFGRLKKVTRNKWIECLFALSVDKPWTKEEDRGLIQLKTQADSYQQKNYWKNTSIQLSQLCKSPYLRSARSCRERWVNKLNPEMERGPWYYDEELKLLMSVIRNGKKWTLISKLSFNNIRTDNALKNRFQTLVKKEQQKLLEQEGKIIFNAYQEMDFNNQIRTLVKYFRRKRPTQEENQLKLNQWKINPFSEQTDINDFYVAVIRKQKRIEILEISPNEQFVLKTTID